MPIERRDKLPTVLAGMDLWQILGLGGGPLGLDADWNRLEHIATYDLLVRQMLGVPATPWGADAKAFGHQTLRDNVALLDDELLQQINARIAAPPLRSGKIRRCWRHLERRGRPLRGGVLMRIRGRF